jgi:hypothetical protein
MRADLPQVPIAAQVVGPESIDRYENNVRTLTLFLKIKGIHPKRVEGTVPLCLEKDVQFSLVGRQSDSEQLKNKRLSVLRRRHMFLEYILPFSVCFQIYRKSHAPFFEVSLIRRFISDGVTEDCDPKIQAQVIARFNPVAEDTLRRTV